MAKRWIHILALTALPFTLCAQDQYFTQIFATPLELNPALSGGIEGTFRASAAYRTQWGSALESPYQTYGVYGDLRFAIGRRRTTGQDFGGAGVSFTSDRVGIYDFNTNNIRLSAAFHKSLNPRRSEYLSGGFYLGIVQRNINFENIVFDDQFNGLDGYTFGTREMLPENNFAHADAGVGVNYAVTPSQNFRGVAGISLSHFLQPSLSFFKRTEGLEESQDIQLYARWAGYVSADIALNKRSRLLPRFAIMTQGPQLQMNLGTNVKFEINKHNTNSLHLGGGLQFAKKLDSLTPSSFYLLAGFEAGNFLFGVSYDLNLEDLVHERIGQNTFELTITYISQYENDSAFCPSF